MLKYLGMCWEDSDLLPADIQKTSGFMGLFTLMSLFKSRCVPKKSKIAG